MPQNDDWAKNDNRDVTAEKMAGVGSVHEDLAMRRQRAQYRAEHRGTREMDFLLGRFARARVGQMKDRELTCFEKLLTLPDPELAGALIDETGDFETETASMIEQISRFHREQNE